MEKICAHCGMKFSKKYNLLRHIRNIHGGREIVLKQETKPEDLVICLGCGKSFLSKKLMYCHARAAHDVIMDHLLIPRIRGKKKKECFEEGEGSADYLNKEGEGSADYLEDFKVLMEGFPYARESKIMEFVGNTEGKYKVTLSFTTEAAIDSKLYVEQVAAAMRRRYRMAKSIPTSTKGRRIIYYCNLNSQKKNEKNRHDLDCPAKLFINIDWKENDNVWNNTIRIDDNHNHHTDTIGALKLLKPNVDVKTKFLQMFELKMTQTEAMNSFTTTFKKEYGESYATARFDRTIFPNSEWVNNLYQRYVKQKFGECNPKAIADKLTEAVNKINETCGSKCAAISVNETNDYSFNLAYMSPFMKRVSAGKNGGDIIFLDSSGTMDSTAVRIFNLMSMSSCGGLPVGVLMTNSEKEENITEALQLHRSLVDDKSFAGYGEEGPLMFMTDKCDAERNSLRNVYPAAVLLLCIFHMLWAVWRWLLKSDHKIASEDRQELYYLIKNLVYSEQKEQFDLQLENMKSHNLILKYTNFWTYFQGYWIPLKDDWAMYGRKYHQLRGQHTNNIVESSFRVLKDKVLNRRKAPSPVHLLESIIEDFESHYVEKIFKIIGGEPDRYLLAKSKSVADFDPNAYVIVKITGFLYEVKKKENGKTYLVNTDMGHCTCPKATYGAPCKHFQMVAQEFHIGHTLDMPKTAEEKKELYYLATGKAGDDMGLFFEGLTFDSPAVSSENMSHGSSKSKTCHPIREISEGPPLETNDDSNIFFHAECEDLLRRFRSMTDDISGKFQSNKKYFFNGLRNMVTQYDKIKTDSALESAMCCFNKFNGMGRSNAGNKKIPVQPTSIARRIFKGQSGSRALRPGRPKKHNKKKAKRNRAPHNLSVCVKENRSLGTSH